MCAALAGGAWPSGATRRGRWCPKAPPRPKRGHPRRPARPKRPQPRSSRGSGKAFALDDQLELAARVGAALAHARDLVGGSWGLLLDSLGVRVPLGGRCPVAGTLPAGWARFDAAAALRAPLGVRSRGRNRKHAKG